MKPHPYTCLPALLAIAGSLALLPSLLEAGSNVPPKPGLIITGKHVVVNDDDWNNDQIWDKVHKPGDLKPGAQNGEEFTTADFPNEGLRDMPDNVPAEPKLVPFTVTATPPPGKSGTLTITKTGGNVKLWKDEIKTSTFDLSDVGSKTSVEFWVEGIEPTNTLQDAGFDAKYHIVGQDPLSAEIRYGITRADIRVDSNNKTIPPSTEPLDEEDERIEFSTKPEHIGKILLENSGDVDHDGVMDSLDGLGLADTGGSAGVANLKLVPMKVKLEKPYDPTRAEVTFHYNASLPREDAKGIKKTVTNNVTTYEIAKRGLRLWKVDGDQRANGIDVTTTGGHFIPSGEPVPWRNLASSSATDTIIYLEYVDLPTGKTYSKEDIVYTIQENIPDTFPEKNQKGYYKDSMNKRTYLAEKESPDGVCVSLLPVEVESMDKFLAGSFDESIIETFGGESSFGLEFRNPSSGESYRFDSIADAYVYDNPYADTDEGEDAFLSDEEVAMGASGSDSEGRLSQDVIFYKQDGKLHFRTIFDQAGEIEIAILKDGEEIGAVTHELVEDEDIGDLIDTIDEVLSDEWGDGGPIILAAQSALFSTEGDEPQFAQARQGGRRGHYRHRNATTKVTMSIWDRIKNNFKDGVRRATEGARVAIKTAALTGKGFVEGAWMGIKDDVKSLAELANMIANPEETAKSFYEAFKALMGLDLTGWKNVGQTMINSFLDTGEKGVPWNGPTDFEVAAYLTGYTSGYIAEQVLAGFVLNGLKAGALGAKIGSVIRRAAKGLEPILDASAEAGKIAFKKAQKAKNSFYRMASQGVANADEVQEWKRMADRLFDSFCPAN